MNIFKIRCLSRCQSYFGSYLQSLTIIAATKEEALVEARRYMRVTGTRFIYDEAEWTVDIIQRGLDSGVIDHHEAPDY